MVAYFIRNFQRLITNEIDDSSHTTKIHTNFCNWHLLRISLSSGLTGFFLVTQTHLPNNSDSSLQLVMAAKTFAKELEHNDCLVKLARGRLDWIELILKKAFKKAYKNDLNAVNGTRASPIKEHHFVQTAFKSDKIFSLFLLAEPFLFTFYSYLMKSSIPTTVNPFRFSYRTTLSQFVYNWQTSTVIFKELL